MGTYTDAGVYVPDIGEAAATWPLPMNQNQLLLDRAVAGRVQELNPTRVFLSNPSLTPSADDTDSNRGNRLYPYASLDRIIDERRGAVSPGPNLAPGRPVIVELLPGPVVPFPPIPPGGYPTDQDFGAAQWFRLPDGVDSQLLDGVEVIGTHPGNQDVGNEEFGSLIVGNFDGSLIKIGSADGDTTSIGTSLRKLAVCNLRGEGVEVLKGIGGNEIEAVMAYGCYRSGFVYSKHGMDAFVSRLCQAVANGTSGVGWGIFVNPAATGPPNLISFYECQSRRNGPDTVVFAGTAAFTSGSTTITAATGSFDSSLAPDDDGVAYFSIGGGGVGGSYYHGRIVNRISSSQIEVSPALSATSPIPTVWKAFVKRSGEMRAIADAANGTSGLSVLFQQCRFGSSMIEVLGSKLLKLIGGYIEGTDGDEPHMIIDAYGAGGPGDAALNKNLAKGCLVDGVYFHGNSTGLPGWGCGLTAIGCQGLDFRRNFRVAGQPSSTSPSVWLDDGLSRMNYVSVLNEVNEAWTDNDSGTDGDNFCHIGGAGSAHNRGEYRDTASGSVLDY